MIMTHIKKYWILYCSVFVAAIAIILGLVARVMWCFENLKVELIEHDDDHIIPEKIVKQLIHKLKFRSGDKL